MLRNKTFFPIEPLGVPKDFVPTAPPVPRVLTALSPFLCCLALAGLPQPARAQNAPPVYRHTDEYGVDLVTGNIEIGEELLSIGSGGGMLNLELHGDLGDVWLNYAGAASLQMDAEGDWSADVWIERSTNTFAGMGPVWISPEEADGATLELTSTHFVWSRPDGTVVRFDRSASAWGPNYARATEIIHPDGRKVRIHYKVVAGDQRIQSVTNSDGYQLKFGYPDSTSSVVTSVQAINNAVDYCDPLADVCTGLSQAWPTVTIAETNPVNYGPNVVTITKPQNETLRYTVSGVVQPSSGGGTIYLITGIKKPGSVNDNVTIAHYPLRITTDGVARTYASAPGTGGGQISRTNPLGHSLVSTLTPDGLRIDWIRDELNRTTDFSYDSQKRLVRITYPEGNYTAYTYDARGNTTQTRVAAKPGSGLADIVTSATFPVSCSSHVTCNKALSTTDALGRTTDYTYDSVSGKLLTVTLPAPVTGGVRPQKRYAYAVRQAYYKNNSGSVVASGAGTSVLTGVSACRTGTNCLGGSDEVKTTIDHGPQTPGTANNLLPVSTTEGSGDGTVSATTSFSYDQIGNLASINGPLAGSADTTRLIYDSNRRRVGIVGPDPDGTGPLKHRAQRFSYSGGLVTAVERAVLNGQSDADWLSYAPLDRLEIVFDANRRRTSERYVAGGTTHALTQYSYEAVGRLECTAARMNPGAYPSLPASACSPGAEGSFGPDRITKLLYDAAGQVTQVRNGVGSVSESAGATTTYTENAKLQTITDGEGNRTSYTYDGHDRLLTTRYPVTGKGAGTSSSSDYEQLGYDAGSNIVTRRLRDGQTISFGYDRLGRLISKDLPGADPDVTYGYTRLGQISAVSQQGQSWAFNFDGLGRPISQSGPMGITSSSYDAAGRRTRLSYPDGLFVDYSRLLTGEITHIRENGAVAGSGVLATYGYDDRGRRVSLTRGNGTVQTYAYDAASRLSQMTDDLAGVSNDLSLAFSYNPEDQIVQVVRSNDAYAWTGSYSVNRAYSSNGLNQYVASGPVIPTYDARGNLTSAGSATFAYNSENMLKSASGGISLAYDPLLRLYEVGGTSGVTRFAYDGHDAIAEYDAANSLVRRHVFGPDINEPVVWIEGSDRRWLHTDERGSVVAVSNSSGQVIGINSYDSWGIPASTNIGRYQYTGQAWLPELGMYHYKARIYSPTLGRFLQPDPIGFDGGMNLYAYAGNDPVGKGDALGLQETIVVTGTRPGSGCTAQGTSGTCVSADDMPGEDYGPHLVGEKGDPLRERRYAAGPQKAPCFTLNARREHHDKWVAKEAARLRSEGYQVATEVSMRVWTPKGSVMARADIVARLPGSPYYIINEIKTGDARLSANQQVVYGANLAVIAGVRGLPVGLKPGDDLPLGNFSTTRCKGLG